MPLSECLPQRLAEDLDRPDRGIQRVPRRCRVVAVYVLALFLSEFEVARVNELIHLRLLDDTQVDLPSVLASISADEVIEIHLHVRHGSGMVQGLPIVLFLQLPLEETWEVPAAFLRSHS